MVSAGRSSCFIFIVYLLNTLDDINKSGKRNESSITFGENILLKMIATF
jgi:hypothetical protein